MTRRLVTLQAAELTYLWDEIAVAIGFALVFGLFYWWGLVILAIGIAGMWMNGELEYL